MIHLSPSKKPEAKVSFHISQQLWFFFKGMEKYTTLGSHEKLQSYRTNDFQVMANESLGQNTLFLAQALISHNLKTAGTFGSKLFIGSPYE
jgi:hypothetical protein